MPILSVDLINPMDMMKNLLKLSLLIFSFAPYMLIAQCYDQVAEDVGIEAIWSLSGSTGGGGVSFADFNQDGFDDLTFATGDDVNILFYTNNGDGTFTEVDPPFIENTQENKGVLWVDFDNDGDKDFFTTSFIGPNRLYENDGNLNFSDVTASVGLPEDDSFTMGANFGDYDFDGYLDLYITNYGHGIEADTNQLYRFDGNTYTDVTFEAGVSDYCDPATGGSICNTSNGRQSFCSSFYDYDMDGDLDLYIANDRTQFHNTLYENNGDGTFTDVSEETHSNIAIFAMNTGFGDANGDGYFDMYVTNIGASSHLKYDPITGAYEETAGADGTIFEPRVGWAGNYFDYDLDGDQDLYVCSMRNMFSEPNAFYVNDGTGNFTEPLYESGGLGGIDYVVSQSNAIGDFNNDGYQDIAVTHYGDHNFHLWQSCESTSNSYIKFQLVGTSSNTDGYGARIELFSSLDNQVFQSASHNGFMGQSSDVLTYGIGEAESLDSVIITWPYPNSETRLYPGDYVLNDLNVITEGPVTGTPDLPPYPGDRCFTDHTADSGITGGFGDSVWEGGGGVSFADFNDDGLDDLTFTTEYGEDVKFYINNGDETFTLLDPPLITNTDESKHILWIDYDNDGDKDIFLACYQAPNRLFENDGSLNFTDVTAALGLPVNDEPTFGANFGDIDQDGFLDLYITNYGSDNSAYQNFMFKNNGGTSFTDITDESGTSNGMKQSFCSTFFDYDSDGDLDLYLSNDRNFFRNALYENDGTGVFTDVSNPTHSGVGIDAMNVGIGDCDNNGHLDIYITDTQYSAHLMNSGNNFFTEEAFERGTEFDRIGWGGSFFDYDNDQDLDLYVNSYENDFGHPNAFYENTGGGFYDEPFGDSGGLAGSDTLSGFVNVIGDLNNDGNMDIVLSNESGNDFRIWKSCENNGNNYFKLKLEGTTSNKDAYGAFVTVYTGSIKTVFQKFNSISYLGQHSDIMHIGIGSYPLVDSIHIDWPYADSDTSITSGIILGEVNHIIEGEGGGPICTPGTACNDSDDCTMNDVWDDDCNCAGTPIIEGMACDDGSDCTHNDAYNVDCDCVGQPIPGDDMDGDGISDDCDPCPEDPDPDCIGPPDFPTVDPDLHIVRKWNEILLESIRLDLARPTVHARNLFHTSVAMWDSYSVYQDPACPYLLGNSVDGFESSFDEFNYSGDLNENFEATVSYACYRVLSHRFENSPNADELQEAYDYLMGQLGYDIDVISIDYSTGDPAHMGNYIADQIINFGLEDGANEEMAYGNMYYEPVNDPLVMDFPGNPNITDYNRWQPLTLETFIDQSGNIIPVETPDFLSPEWGQVSNFALEEEDLTSYFRDGFEYQVYHDPSDPPMMDLDGSGDSDLFEWGFSLVSKWSSHLDPTDGVMIDISPNTLGNPDFVPTDFNDYDQFYLAEGGSPGNGYDVNPHTGLAYEPNMVPRGDYARVLAEFWADGPDSETPPGHWFTLLNFVSDHPDLVKKFEGQGDELDDTEWYVKSYFIMGGAMHDAAVAAWGVKGWYDYIRPVSAIRAMADLGQSSDPNLPSYHPAGMKLVDGLVELVTEGDTLAGDNNEHVDKVKLFSWLGHDAIIDEEVDEAGVGWILAENWVPYQRASFVTPPFAGYVSGHSTYSRAAAEVMTLLTGDAYFPGGMGTFLAEQDEFLVFEDGPSIDIELQWATYYDAAEQSALSRIWGGIHPPFDDIPGREIGKEVGVDAFNRAKTYFQDSDADEICDPQDLCDNFDDNLIGTACDDGDDCTEGETYDSECGCTGGEFIDADNDGVCAAEDPDDNDPCVPDENHPECITCNFTTIHFDDFEGEPGNWSDRAADVVWGSFAEANSGTDCFLIRDNSGLHSTMGSHHLDYSMYDQLEITFTFITTGFDEPGERFYLEFSGEGGDNYVFIDEWVYETDFENDVREFPSVVISGLFIGESSSFQLVCEGSDDSDQVYIDDIEVRGCVETLMPEIIASDRSSVAELNIYPNPTIEGQEFILENKSLSLIKEVSIYDLNGQLLRSIPVNNTNREIPLKSEDLTAGMYLVKVELEGEYINKRVLILE